VIGYGLVLWRNLTRKHLLFAGNDTVPISLHSDIGTVSLPAQCRYRRTAGACV